MIEETTTASARRQRVVEAGIGVFLRYGYARTTMADIAQSAGLSRPTLYLAFPDKEGVFRAVIETMVAAKLGTIREGLTERSSLEAKLRFACEAWGAEGFELVLANPDAKDMFNICFAPVREGYAAFEELIAGLLREPLGRAGLDVQADELARVIVFSTKGFKDVARDGADMRRMIGVQVALISVALGRGAEGVRT
jgi:AcrR family transcriptional regulator